MGDPPGVDDSLVTEVIRPQPPDNAFAVRLHIDDWIGAAGELRKSPDATDSLEERRRRRQIVAWITKETGSLADWGDVYNLDTKTLHVAAKALSVQPGSGVVTGVEAIEPAIYVLDDLSQCLNYPVPDKGETCPIAQTNPNKCQLHPKLDNRIKVDGSKGVVVIDGESYEVAPSLAELVNALVAAEGEYIAANQAVDRPDRLMEKAPAKVAEIIDRSAKGYRIKFPKNG